MSRAWTTVVTHGAPFFLGTLITWGQPLATPGDWTLRVILAWILPGSIALGVWRRWCPRSRRMAGWWALLLAAIGWWLILLPLIWIVCRELSASPIVYVVAAALLLLSLFVGRRVWTVKRWGLGLVWVLAGWLIVGPHGFVNPFGSPAKGQPVSEEELQQIWADHWPARLPTGGERYRFTLSGFYLWAAVALDIEVHADGTGTLNVRSTRSPSNRNLFSWWISDGHVSFVERRELTRRQVEDIVAGFERHGFWDLAREPVMLRGRWSGRSLGSGGMYHGPVWEFRGVRDGSAEQSLEMASHFSGSYLSTHDKAAWRKLSKLAITMLQLSEIRIAKQQL